MLRQKFPSQQAFSAPRSPHPDKNFHLQPCPLSDYVLLVIVLLKASGGWGGERNLKTLKPTLRQKLSWKMCYGLKNKNKIKKTAWVHKQVNRASQEVRSQASRDLCKPHNCEIQTFALRALQTVTFFRNYHWFD